MRTAAIWIALATSVLAAEPPSVAVTGPSGQTRSLQLADLQVMAVREFTVADPHSKQPTRYRGVNLTTILSLVGTPAGESLRGKALALRVQVEAADKYVATFSLAELDAGVGNTEAVLSFEQDGKPLATDLGTFRLVVPTDKRAARWVRQVVAVRVVD